MPTGDNPRSRQNLTPFPKGVSGNKLGRKKKLLMTREYERVLPEKMSKTAFGKAAAAELGFTEGTTWARAIALGTAKKAITNPAAAQEMREPTEGKALQRLRMEGADGGPVQVEVQTENELRESIAAILARIRSRESNASTAKESEGKTPE